MTRASKPVYRKWNIHRAIISALGWASAFTLSAAVLRNVFHGAHGSVGQFGVLWLCTAMVLGNYMVSRAFSTARRAIINMPLAATFIIWGGLGVFGGWPAIPVFAALGLSVLIATVVMLPPILLPPNPMWYVNN